jgi:hypothetical protein
MNFLPVFIMLFCKHNQIGYAMDTLEIPENSDTVPLILDVDGSLLRTNILLENFWAAMGKNPFATLWAVATTLRRPARLKHKLRLIYEPAVGLLPVDESVLEFARVAQKSGRRVILTSGADQFLVDRLAQTLDFPGVHYGSNESCNLTGANKAALLVAKFGKEEIIDFSIQRKTSTTHADTSSSDVKR